jgi:hypothetical protein
MSHVPDHRPAYTPRFNAATHITDSQIPWFQLLPPLLFQCHHSCILVTLGRSLVRPGSNDMSMENERNILSPGSASGEGFKVEIHRRDHIATLFLINLVFRKCSIACVSGRCMIFDTGELVVHISRSTFFVRRQLIISAWYETSDQGKDMRVGCVRTFSSSSLF